MKSRKYLLREGKLLTEKGEKGARKVCWLVKHTSQGCLLSKAKR